MRTREQSTLEHYSLETDKQAPKEKRKILVFEFIKVHEQFIVCLCSFIRIGGKSSCVHEQKRVHELFLFMFI